MKYFTTDAPRVVLLMHPFAGYDRGLLEGMARARIRTLVPQASRPMQPCEHRYRRSAAPSRRAQFDDRLAGASLISPGLFECFELPRAMAYCDALKRASGFAFVHACGHETIMLKNLIATGADCLELDPRRIRQPASEPCRAVPVCLECSIRRKSCGSERRMPCANTRHTY